MVLNTNRYELHKKQILLYRQRHKEKFNTYMRKKNLEYYYQNRYGMTKQELEMENIVCDIHRLFKRPYNKKV